MDIDRRSEKLCKAIGITWEQRLRGEYSERLSESSGYTSEENLANQIFSADEATIIENDKGNEIHLNAGLPAEYQLQKEIGIMDSFSRTQYATLPQSGIEINPANDRTLILRQQRAAYSTPLSIDVTSQPLIRSLAAQTSTVPRNNMPRELPQKLLSLTDNYGSYKDTYFPQSNLQNSSLATYLQGTSSFPQPNLQNSSLATYLQGASSQNITQERNGNNFQSSFNQSSMQNQSMAGHSQINSEGITDSGLHFHPISILGSSAISMMNESSLNGASVFNRSSVPDTNQVLGNFGASSLPQANIHGYGRTIDRSGTQHQSSESVIKKPFRYRAPGSSLPSPDFVSGENYMPEEDEWTNRSVTSTGPTPNLAPGTKWLSYNEEDRPHPSSVGSSSTTTNNINNPGTKESHKREIPSSSVSFFCTEQCQTEALGANYQNSAAFVNTGSSYSGQEANILQSQAQIRAQPHSVAYMSRESAGNGVSGNGRSYIPNTQQIILSRGNPSVSTSNMNQTLQKKGQNQTQPPNYNPQENTVTRYSMWQSVTSVNAQRGNSVHYKFFAQQINISNPRPQSSKNQGPYESNAFRLLQYPQGSNYSLGNNVNPHSISDNAQSSVVLGEILRVPTDISSLTANFEDLTLTQSNVCSNPQLNQNQGLSAPEICNNSISGLEYPPASNYSSINMNPHISEDNSQSSIFLSRILDVPDELSLTQNSILSVTQALENESRQGSVPESRSNITGAPQLQIDEIPSAAKCEATDSSGMRFENEALLATRLTTANSAPQLDMIPNNITNDSQSQMENNQNKKDGRPDTVDEEDSDDDYAGDDNELDIDLFHLQEQFDKEYPDDNQTYAPSTYHNCMALLGAAQSQIPPECRPKVPPVPKPRNILDLWENIRDFQLVRPADLDANSMKHFEENRSSCHRVSKYYQDDDPVYWVACAQCDFKYPVYDPSELPPHLLSDLYEEIHRLYEEAEPQPEDDEANDDGDIDDKKHNSGKEP